jgi:hypothetical protein
MLKKFMYGIACWKRTLKGSLITSSAKLRLTQKLHLNNNGAGFHSILSKYKRPLVQKCMLMYESNTG